MYVHNVHVNRVSTTLLYTDTVPSRDCLMATSQRLAECHKQLRSTTGLVSDHDHDIMC